MTEFVLSEVKAETAVLAGLITKEQDEEKGQGISGRIGVSGRYGRGGDRIAFTTCLVSLRMQIFR